MDSDELKQLKIAHLQLQRSALLDTQTIMQIMLDKGICDAQDIVDTRTRIQKESPDVRKLDNAILEAGGFVYEIPELPEGVKTTASLRKELDQLKSMLTQIASGSTNLQ